MKLLILCFYICLIGCSSSRSYVRHAIASQAQEHGFHHHAHHIAILDNGFDALVQRIKLIRQAKRQIDLQTFLYHHDDSGKLIGYELYRAAKRGVRIRVLVDQMFLGLNTTHTASLIRTFPQFEVKVYNPVGSSVEPSTLEIIGATLFDFNKTNQRMHNKLFCIDGTHAICGGRNIGNDYFDYQKGLNFRDRDVLITGPVVSDLQQSFNSYWSHPICVDIKHFRSIKKLIDAEIELPSPEKLNISTLKLQVDTKLQTAAPIPFETVDSAAAWIDPPGKFLGTNPAIEPGHSLAALQMQAKQELLFQSPYLVLSDRAIYIFKMLHKNGAKVRISTNSLAATDSWPTYAYSHRQKKLMLKKLHLEIFEFKPFPADLKKHLSNYPSLRSAMNRKAESPLQRNRDPYLCLHAKCFTIDDTHTVIGSYNLDPRSQNYNTELMLAIGDKNFTKKMKSLINRDLHPDNSWVIAARQRPIGIREINSIFSLANDIIRQLTSVDIWPLRYATSYELKKQGIVVPINHKDFHQHYRDVGQFPGIGLAETKKFMTRLTKTLGGVLRPIL